jgi:hypothetical protein
MCRVSEKSVLISIEKTDRLQKNALKDKALPSKCQEKETKGKPPQLTVLTLQKFLYPVEKFPSAPGIIKCPVSVTTRCANEMGACRQLSFSCYQMGI